jgi:putative flippase GtrA
VLGQFARFVVVGCVGFAIDGGLLYLLVLRGFNPFLARAISFPPAVTITWYLNRIWTFAAGTDSRRREYMRYMGVQVAGALSNYAMYATLLLFIPRTSAGVMSAFAAGCAVGLCVNFFGARLLVFVSESTCR